MTELDKMLNGELYDCGDPELMALWIRGKNLMREFNNLDYGDREGQLRILEALLGTRGAHVQVTAPFYVDYGRFIHLGNNCEINMNCVFLDCNTITIGDNALIGPSVQIYTVFHPLNAAERCSTTSGEGLHLLPCRSLPVKLGANVWIGGGSIIMPGVTVGDNVVVGAGSVVTKSLPDSVLAVGNPCKILRSL